MVRKLYMTEMSPPCRAVLLVARELGVDLENIEVDIPGWEHYDDEFLKMNPQHTVPTLDDNGIIVWDSHAIAAYLVNKYAQDDRLYPKDPKRRAVVDQRLHFDTGVLYARVCDLGTPFLFNGLPHTFEETKEKTNEAYQFLENFLDHEWLAGEALTIADLCCAATVSSLNGIIPFPDDCPKLKTWYERTEALPYFKEVNNRGKDEHIEFFKSIL